MNLPLLLLLGLAVARAVRLWRDDVIAEGARDYVDSLLEVDDESRWFGFTNWLSELLGCPWCLSAWLSAAAVIFADSATSRSVDLPVFFWLATWWTSNLAYWLLELIADRDALAWREREDKGLV